MLGAADMPIGCALTFSEPAEHSCLSLAPETHMAGIDPAMQRQIECGVGRYAVGWRSTGCRSRWRALRPKNRAWLTTAETTASWNGFAIRNAGSGRCPVRKRSG